MICPMICLHPSNGQLFFKFSKGDGDELGLILARVSYFHNKPSLGVVRRYRCYPVGKTKATVGRILSFMPSNKAVCQIDTKHLLQ